MKETTTIPVEILDYDPSHARDFAELNYEWLNEFFEVEAHDAEMLDDPKTHIIEPGGKIFIAQVNGGSVGTVALIADEKGVFELAKMAVTKKFRGLGIGKKLMERAVWFCKEKKVKKVYLESNSKLTPALTLYEQFGFEHTENQKGTPYCRCDVYMELAIK